MIEMQGVSKLFGRRLALDDVNFTVERGEFVALLGPNGSGKSTALRILAGFVAATRGTARIGGWDVMTHSLEVRRRLGYLPENVPLYVDLRVDEYLRFRAGIKGVPRKLNLERVNRMKDFVGLHEVGALLIGALSRGLRQRVGLADALLNEPDVLILDEPTLGLDPMENEGVRSLLAGLAGRHTILLSTHNLGEAERLCSRVMLLDRGRLVSRSMNEFLKIRGHCTEVLEFEARASGADVCALAGGMPGVLKARATGCLPDGWSRLLVEHEPGADLRKTIAGAAAEAGWEARHFVLRERRLEDAYLDWRAGLHKSGENL